ncbi:serine/threonine-protein kinase [Vitiosangium sp. GDMCC 1.1324]|uniref:serine/threonine-protein kinase n=1 Tax=Vitiosangium sp. (strain GDMCC 1.1324) TaxID=2138576 RepID=UPI000D3B175C|nr:serine/threonine-protein kinase [Vitiosangium sp. GDMCC 1.1324]PTL81384.1 hypothetical protein DAT35_25090 [Vitiosangium sp. GDMCC 1.1324]
MTERVLKCPQCNAPLAPSRFARSVICSFCGTTVLVDQTAVSAARFREAFQSWNLPSHLGYTSWWSIGDSHWAPGRLIARGEHSDVYLAERARWPTERVLLKVLREPGDAPLFQHEWDVLEQLQQSTANGAATFTTRLPQPVVRGVLREGPRAGAQAMALRWTSGFVHTFEAVRNAYPAGIDPRVSIWMWRRILETLSFIHSTGLVHGAVLPQHLLVQHGEHGVRLVGFSCTDLAGARLSTVSSRFEDFYPTRLLGSKTLTPSVDLVMSARCIIAVLGGEPSRGSVPGSVPGPLAALLRRVASAEGLDESQGGAWTLREQVGEVGSAVFGRPSFHPLVMP